MKSLYVTDRNAVGSARVAEVVRALADARSLTVQVREPKSADRERLEWSRVARETLSPSIPVYVNGRFDVALAAGAQGVHLPASGLPPARIRAVTPRGFRIGVSTHSIGEALRAIEGRVDLVVIGPIYDTPSKRAFGPPLGPEALSDLSPLSGHDAEVYAIGGVTEEKLPELARYRDRISGVAAVRLFQDASDPAAVAERIAAR